MHDGVASGRDQPHPGGFSVGSDPKVLVATATTVAALLLAGSAYVWRRGSSGAMNLGHAASDGTTSQTDTPHGKDVSDTTKARLRRDATGKGRANSTGRRASVSALGGRPLSDDADATDDGDDQGGSGKQREAAAGSMGKSARAKERRRRGKDPMKELMKPGGGKLAKILKATDPSPSSATTAPPPPRSRTTSTSEVQRRASTSRHQEKTPSDDSSATQKAGSSSSSTAFPSSSTASEPTQDRLRSHSTSPQSDRLRSRPPNDVAHAGDHELPMSKSKNRNSDAASTISSASSSTATEATTLSTSSTAPSSLSSSVTGLHPDADATPKGESGRANAISTPSPASPISQGKKPQREASDPWDWDGAGSSGASQSKPSPQKSQTKPRIASNPPSSATEGTPLPYASIVSAKSPEEEDSRSTVGTRTGAKQHMLPSLSSSDDNAETVEAEGEAEEEVPPLVFPSLNNPAPPDSASSSLSASTQSSFSVGPASTPSSSLSRPHSRASNSSSAHSGQIGGLKSKSPAPRNAGAAAMAPFSLTKAETGAGSGHRHVPAPLGSVGKRPATPVTGSAASSPLLSGSIVPPSPSSQSFGQAGSSTVALSTQTQVAGLRGALEASRLREQKQKDELERITKERDIMQWENAAWRRREAELQAQVQQMMHQLQGYNAFFASVNQGLHLPQIVSPAPQSVPPPSSSTGAGAQPVSARDNENDDTPPANAGDPQIVSPTSAEKGDNDTSGGNSSKKNGDGGGVDEGSPNAQDPSVPELDSAAASPANAAVSGEAQDSQAAAQPLNVTTGLAHPTPIAPVPFNPTLSPGVMSPSAIHSPLGSFAHYPFHAAPPVGFGLHGLPSPIAHSFHIPPHPLQHPPPHQQLPFMAPGSAPQSPGIPMIVPQSLAHINPNPFVVSPAAAYARPGTPGTLGAMSMLNGHPHPHTPAGMGMGLGNSMSSPFAMAGPGSGAASPDLTSSPSSTTTFLMQDRGRRRMSSGSASGGPGRSLRARNSITMLPLDAGIGSGKSSKTGGKNSSGSSVNGDGSGEEQAVGDAEEGDFNEVLASAILKRPESVMMGSSRKGSFRGGSSASSLGDGATSPASGLGLTSGSVSLNGIWTGYGQSGARTESPQQHEPGVSGKEEDEQPQEFVFPSLNAVVGEGKATLGSYPGSASSSVSQSPETKSPQLRSNTPALQTLIEEDVHEGSMAKAESGPTLSEPEPMERSPTAQ